MDKLYLCNFKNPKCNKSFFCGSNDGECFHTLFPEFAADPNSSDDNFDIYCWGNDGVFMVERTKNEIKK